MKKGFTLIELLVVIAIIVIIAAMVMVRIGGASEDAKRTRMKSDVMTITNEINTAKSLSGKTLARITGSENTSYNNCNGRDLRNITESDSCVTDLKNAFTKIAQESRMGISGTYPRDQWNSPYLIDENEDTSMYPCGALDPYSSGEYMKDMVFSVGPDGRMFTSDDVWSGELGIRKIDNIKCPN